MNRPDYTEFDAELINLIKAGKNTAMVLEYKPTLRALAEPHQGSSTPVFRVIDRRLQALRKRGAIRFNGKHWEVA